VSAEAPAAPEPPKVPVWKNPFVIAFAVGVVFLTALPFMQQRFLKAPPPGPPVGAWAGSLRDGGTFTSEDLKGRVWLASFAADPVRRAEFGDMLRHFDDLPPHKVALVSFVAPGEAGPFGGDAWYVVSGTPEQFDSLVQKFQPTFQEALATRNAGGFTPDYDAGTSPAEWLHVPAIAVIDQNGAFRVFWNEQSLGRGNAINAARLLARQGPTP